MKIALEQVALLKEVDYSSLPKSQEKKLQRSLTNAEQIYEKIDAVEAAKKAIASAAPEYAPILSQVRTLERLIKQKAKAKQNLTLELRGVDEQEEKEKIKNKIKQINDEVADLKNQIPETWNKTNKEFKKLTGQQSNRARMQFRRSSDRSYADIRDLSIMIESAPELSPILLTLQDVEKNIDIIDGNQLSSRLGTIYTALNTIPGTNKIAKKLSDAKRAAKNKEQKIDRIQKNISEATAAIIKEIDWRKKAKTTVYKALVNFETYTRYNLGLREQKRLADEQVDAITPCLAKHRNLSLQF